MPANKSWGSGKLATQLAHYNRPWLIPKSLKDERQTSCYMATSMEFEDSYNNRELKAVWRMMSSSAFPAPKNNAGSGYYRKEVQYGFGHIGREESRTGGEKQCDGAGMLKSWTSHAIFLLQRKTNAALKVFIAINKAFDDKNLGEGFNNSDEATAACNLVGDAFDSLCASHGELAAAAGGSWAEIAGYKPGYMNDYEALKKKKDAISNARVAIKLKKARAMKLRAK